MFIYQGVIMALVAVAIYLLAFIFKMKSRKILVILMATVFIIGGAALYYVQYFFNNHYYDQHIDTAAVEKINFTDDKIANIGNILSGYEKVSGKESSETYKRVYDIDAQGAHSKITATVYVFSNPSDAAKNFTTGKSFYDSKNYIPLDPLKSKKSGEGTRYLITGIKSQYQDYTDLIYLPSKISYLSDVVIESNNVVITLSETANKPVTNKEQVLNEIVTKLG